MADPDTQWGVVCMGSQMAKSEFGFNEIGRKLDDAPTPVIYVGPTRTDVEDKIEPRIMSMIRQSPSLSSKFLDGKANKKTRKFIAGQVLLLVWAGSSAQLSSQNAGLCVIDELDQMEDIKGQGSVVGLTRARMSSYPDRLGIIVSTPTVGNVETYEEHGLVRWKEMPGEEIQSKTWQQWQQGSREELAIACSEKKCGEYFIPRSDLLWFPKGCTPDQALTEARLTCPHCGSQMTDLQVKKAVRENWVFVGPGQKIVDGKAVGPLINKYKRTFWVSGLLSPFVTIGERAAQWIEAARSKDQGDIQSTLNTAFGELYSISGDAPDWEIVDKCRGDYKVGDVPAKVQRIFITVDVHKRRLNYVVRGWGYGYESWALEKGEIYAKDNIKSLDDPCWAEVEALMEKEWAPGLYMKAIAIDSGYEPDVVDAFCMKHNSVAYACVGSRGQPTKLINATPQEVDKRGKRKKQGFLRWTLDHGYFKGWVHDRIGWPQDQVGAWHIPNDEQFDEDYCRQVVAEQKIRLQGGRVKWIKVRDANHFLDCEYMQAAMAKHHRIQNLKDVLREAPKRKPVKKKKGKSFVEKHDDWI